MRIPAALLLTTLVLPAAWAHDWNGIALDARDHVYVVDAEDGQVWRVDPEGKVSVHVPGTEERATCPHTHHLVFDRAGNLWLPSG